MISLIVRIKKQVLLRSKSQTEQIGDFLLVADKGHNILTVGDYKNGHGGSKNFVHT